MQNISSTVSVARPGTKRIRSIRNIRIMAGISTPGIIQRIMQGINISTAQAADRMAQAAARMEVSAHWSDWRQVSSWTWRRRYWATWGFRRTMNTAIKAMDDSGSRIGGYVVVYGSPAQRDQQDEFFSPDTYLGLDWPVKTRPMLYQHGLDRRIGSQPIGVIDTLRPDQTGVWAEAALDPDHPHIDTIRAQVSQGKLSWSSGSLPHLVRKGPGGHITRWPIVEGSLTRNPAERRMTHVAPIKTVMAAYKSLGIPTDYLLEEDSVNPEQMEQLADLVAARMQTTQQPAIQPTQTTQPAQPAAVKTLPAPLPAPQPSAAKPRIEVLRDLRFAEWSASDMAFYYSLMSDLNSLMPTGNRPVSQIARKFIGDMTRDSERKFERQLAHKAHREIAAHRINEREAEKLIDRLPYKSLDAVWANDYQAIKSNELDTTGQAGYGQEWVPAVWRETIWERIRIANAVARNITVVPMATNPWYIPLEQADPVMYYVPETTDGASLV